MKTVTNQESYQGMELSWNGQHVMLGIGHNSKTCPD